MTVLSQEKNKRNVIRIDRDFTASGIRNISFFLEINENLKQAKTGIQPGGGKFFLPLPWPLKCSYSILSLLHVP